MSFFIKRGDTLPELKFQLTQRLMSKNDITDEMMENIAVTFSMINKVTGLFKVANVSASLRINTEYTNLDDPKYELTYCFKEKDTNKEGQYSGEFMVNFLGKNCGSISFPTNRQIPIHVTKGLTKTTVLPVTQFLGNLFDITFDDSFG